MPTSLQIKFAAQGWMVSLRRQPGRCQEPCLKIRGLRGAGRHGGSSRSQLFTISVQIRSPTSHVLRGVLPAGRMARHSGSQPRTPLGHFDHELWQHLCELLSLPEPLRISRDHCCPLEISRPSQCLQVISVFSLVEPTPHLHSTPHNSPAGRKGRIKAPNQGPGVGLGPCVSSAEH